MILIDTRERKYSHIEEYFLANGIEYEKKKLDVGDYLNTDNPKVVIDRKANLQEICVNLSKGKENYSRFARECKRAFDSHMTLIVLIEGTNCRDLADIKDWKSKYSKHTGRWLYNEMFRLTMAYGIKWKLCKKNETAKKILELLNYDKRRNIGESSD